MATTTRTRTYETHIEIADNVREQEIGLLNQRLADTSDLYSQIKQAHWNVKGTDFMQLHLLFDQLAEELFPYVDEIAERITALGGVAKGTVRMAASATTLPEFPDDVVKGMDHVTCLVERYGQYVAATREAIDTTDQWGDPTTADLFTEISRLVDKQLYFLESHLQA